MRAAFTPDYDSNKRSLSFPDLPKRSANGPRRPPFPFEKLVRDTESYEEEIRGLKERINYFEDERTHLSVQIQTLQKKLDRASRGADTVRVCDDQCASQQEKERLLEINQQLRKQIESSTTLLRVKLEKIGAEQWALIGAVMSHGAHARSASQNRRSSEDMVPARLLAQTLSSSLRTRPPSPPLISPAKSPVRRRSTARIPAHLPAMRSAEMLELQEKLREERQRLATVEDAVGEFRRMMLDIVPRRPDGLHTGQPAEQVLRNIQDDIQKWHREHESAQDAVRHVLMSANERLEMADRENAELQALADAARMEAAAARAELAAQAAELERRTAATGDVLAQLTKLVATVGDGTETLEDKEQPELSDQERRIAAAEKAAADAKDTLNSEMAFLGDREEELRTELRDAQADLSALLEGLAKTRDDTALRSLQLEKDVAALADSVAQGETPSAGAEPSSTPEEPKKDPAIQKRDELIRDAKRRIMELEIELSQEKRQLEVANALQRVYVADKELKMQAQDAEVKQLRKQLAEASASARDTAEAAAAREANAAEREAELSRLKAETDAKEAEVGRLTALTDAKESELARLTSLLADATERLQLKDSKLEEAAKAMTELEEELRKEKQREVKVHPAAEAV